MSYMFFYSKESMCNCPTCSMESMCNKKEHMCNCPTCSMENLCNTKETMCNSCVENFNTSYTNSDIQNVLQNKRSHNPSSYIIPDNSL
jgi:hypothetical protein